MANLAVLLVLAILLIVAAQHDNLPLPALGKYLLLILSVCDDPLYRIFQWSWRSGILLLHSLMQNVALCTTGDGC